MRIFTCICSKVLRLPEGQTDVKCAHCGRVYTYNGRFLWQEEPGNDQPGSTGVLPVSAGERRAEDEGEALGEAFAEGRLPEEDRRADGSDTAVQLGERLDAAPKKKRR